MKIERLFIYCLLAGAFLLASCSGDDMTDNPIVETLPEGMYPLTFTATQGEVMATPQTRVTDYDDTADGTHKSKWDGGDQIKVKVSDNTGNTMGTTTCTLDENGNITAYNPQLYWQTTGNYTINAWYSNITGRNTTSTTVSLDNQSSGLAYVLKADQLTNKNYKSGNIALTFKHQLAKVRVKVVKGTYTGNLNVTAVSVKGYTSCTVTNGTVSSPSGSLGTIKMKQNGEYWEANLVPGTEALGKEITINADNKTTTCTLTSAVTLTAAQMYTCTVTVDKKVVNISDITGNEYTVKGNVHLKGDGNSRTLRLTMESGSKLTLENVKLTAPDNNHAITCNGNATITLQGENTLSGYSAIFVNRGTLTISGADDDKLTATGVGRYGSGAGIGATNNANIIIEGGNITATSTTEAAGIGSAGWGKTCGAITIKGGIIEAKGGNYSAGIGGSNSGACGNIIITGGNIKAYGGSQSPGIGNGDYANCGNITISGASTVVYAKKGSGKNPSSIGGNNYSGSCGTVTIGLECKVTQE